MLLLICLTLIFCLFVWVIADAVGYVGPPLIPGIPEMKGYPILGCIVQLHLNPALKCMQWSLQNKTPVFQVRFGRKRVIVVNSFEDVTFFWVKSSRANNSRPTSYTFHTIVSLSQGLTIGSTPACSSLNREKKAILMQLSQHQVEQLTTILDEESTRMIRQILRTNPHMLGPPSSQLLRHVRKALPDIDVMPYAQRFTLQSAIYVTYGIKLDFYNKDAELAQEIISVENEILHLRSATADYRDLFPICRLLPFLNSKPDSIRHRRDVYMNDLYAEMSLRTNNGDPDVPNCLLYKVLCSRYKLLESETQSLCLTMVSAGLDNIPLNFCHLLGHLSHPYGAGLQEIAYESLLQLSNNDLLEAWDKAASNMDCDFVMALILETLRYFTVSPLALPRMTTKSINYKGTSIARDTCLFMNAYAANHDPKQFDRPDEFLPYRWLTNDSLLDSTRKTVQHFSFGAGSRMCSGNCLAIKELYTLTCRMILFFKIKAPRTSPLMELDPFKSNTHPNSISFEPNPFKVRLFMRISVDSEKLYNKVSALV